MTAHLLALGAMALWASLAALGVSLSHVPPFLLTGLALLVGSVIALPLSRFDWRQWRIPTSTLVLGVYGLFGYHFLFFIALRHAPPVQANLVNYLWPLGIVVMAPLFLPGVSLTARHVLAALIGFAGAALAILGGEMSANDDLSSLRRAETLFRKAPRATIRGLSTASWHPRVLFSFGKRRARRCIGA